MELVENQQTWIQLKGALEKRLSPQVWATWINQIKCLQDDGKTLRIGLPDTFSLNWVKDHYRHVIEEELETIGAIDLQFDLHELGAKPTAPSVDQTEKQAEEILEVPELDEESRATAFTAQFLHRENRNSIHATFSLISS